MPISSIDGLPAEHWLEVKSIIAEAVESIGEPKFSVRLVSDSDEIGIIQKRIIQNVYSSDVVVCDVSAKNPNVMFELGLRLAFDKPVVIVKDDKTDYSFDTGIIEHVGYPRDLRFTRIVEFKSLLAAKVLATYRATHKRPDVSPFLKSFGTFKVAVLEEKEVSPERFVLDAVEQLRDEVRALRRITVHAAGPSLPALPASLTNEKLVEEIQELALEHMLVGEITDKRDLLTNKPFLKALAERLAGTYHFGFKTAAARDEAIQKVFERLP